MTKHNKTNVMQYDADAIIRAGIDCYIAQVYNRVARYAFLCRVFGYDEKSLKKEVRERATLMGVVIPNAQLQHDAAAAYYASRAKCIIDAITTGARVGDTAESIILELARLCQEKRFSYKMLFEKKSKTPKNTNGGEKTRLEKFAESLSLDDIKNLRGLLKKRESYIKNLDAEKRAERKAIEKQARERAAEKVRKLRADKKAQDAAKKQDAAEKRRAEKQAKKQADAAAKKQAESDKKLIESREKTDSAYDSALRAAEKARADYMNAKNAALDAFAQRAESKKARNAAKKAIKAARAVRVVFQERMTRLAERHNKKQAVAQALRRAERKAA